MEKQNINKCNLKYEKLKLHIKYIVGISLGIEGVTIAATCYSKNDFVVQFSFAGTISSIILSVIAIFMTIIGETKSDNTKDKLVNVSERLELIAESINDATSKLEETINSNGELYNGINSVENKLESINHVITSKGIEIGTEDAAITTDDNERGHNCYIKIFNDISNRLPDVLYRDLSLVLFYINVKKGNGATGIQYIEFTEETEKLQVQFNNQPIAWNLALIFAKASWESDEFNEYVYNKISIKYYDDVTKIQSLCEVKENETIKNENS